MRLFTRIIVLACAAMLLLSCHAARAGVVTSPSGRVYNIYDFQESISGGAIKYYRLAIPQGLAKVRGLLVVSNYNSGDSRDYYTWPWYEEFLQMHDFAFVGGRGDPSHMQSLQVFHDALPVWATSSGHPELINLPYATAGFSAGGGFASTLLVYDTSRVIVAGIMSARINYTGVTPSFESLRTPVIETAGELEVDPNNPVITSVLEAYRPTGALFGYATTQGQGHAQVGQEVLVMPYLDAAVRLRYPSTGDVLMAPLKMKPLDPMSGWVADDTTWTNGLTNIAAARQFRGDIGKSSWLLNQDMAFIYRAYATYNRPLTITSPTMTNSWCNVLAPGSSMQIVVDATKFSNWTKLEFYDDSRKLGQVTQSPTQFTATNLATGYHVFSVLGTDSQGNVRPSNPVIVIVHR